MFDEKNEPIFAGILVKYKDFNKNLPYKEIETDNNLKQGILIHLNKNDKLKNENSLYKYHLLDESKYILSVSFINPFLGGKTLQIIIEGNVKNINYLGNKEDINHIEQTYPKPDIYNYGIKTGELFQNYKDFIKIFEKEFGIKMHKESFGYYIETIFTNEINTIIRLDKKNKKTQIVSHNLINNIFFTGNKHKNEKFMDWEPPMIIL